MEVKEVIVATLELKKKETFSRSLHFQLVGAEK